MPNNFFISFGVFISLPFICISFVLLIASSGVIFCAFLAADKHDKYTVTKPNIIDSIIGKIEMLNSIFTLTAPSKIFPTTIVKIYTANIPASIPKGISYKA